MLPLDPIERLCDRIELVLVNHVLEYRVSPVLDLGQGSIDGIASRKIGEGIRHDTQHITSSEPDAMSDSDMACRLPLDHLVYAVPDLAAAIEMFRTRLGHAPTRGGHHPGLGTHNAILPLRGGSYVELIARDPRAPDPAGPRPFGLDTLTSSRLVTWAARSRAIERDVTRARNASFDPGPILEMKRRGPDGRSLRWKLSLRSPPFGDGLVPFLIDWGESPHPATHTPPGPIAVELVRFAGRHPDTTRIGAALEALGARLPIVGSDEIGLEAELVSPSGRLVLD
ncbi:MAG TPA: VOC family protein [Deltaproteobacteria bacterium]|nr:VOC family protein [Deltaproteobacteria bacterium]